MTKRVLASVALIAWGLSAPAVAADMKAKAKAPPPPVVVYDWSGAYVGFSIGGVQTEVVRHYPDLPLIGVPAETYTSKGDDVIYDFHAGAQWQWGPWVLGVEAGYAAGFKEMPSQVALNPVTFIPNFAAYHKITNLFTVGPRLGLAWDRWMIYGTGGYASADLKGQHITISTGIQTGSSGQSRHDGWFAGGGLEFMVHKGALVDVIFGAEYQHFDVRPKRTFTAPGASLQSFDLDAAGDIFRARLTIKTQGYGWWGAP